MDKLLNICGNKLLKSKIIGWKRSNDEKHNYCMDIILDSGGIYKVLVQTWNYDRQCESLERSEEKYAELEKWLNKEFYIIEDTPTP